MKLPLCRKVTTFHCQCVIPILIPRTNTLYFTGCYFNVPKELNPMLFLVTKWHHHDFSTSKILKILLFLQKDFSGIPWRQDPSTCQPGIKGYVLSFTVWLYSQLLFIWLILPYIFLLQFKRFKFLHFKLVH